MKNLFLLALCCLSAMAQPRFFGNIQTQQVRPITGSTHSLGTTGARWTNFFTDRITLTTGAGNGFTTAIHPSADAAFDIGSIAAGNFRFKDLWLSGAVNAYSLDLNNGTAITGAVRPSTGSTYALGTTGARWTNSFFDRITLSDTAGLGFGSNLYPAGDNVYAFGTGAYRWASANIAGTVTTGNVVSQTASTHSLGTTGNRWTNSFLDRITLSTGAGQGFTTTIKPSAAYAFNIGDTTDYWNLFYARVLNLRSQNSFSTPASINIRSDTGTLLFTMSDTGVGAGDFRVYNGASPMFEVFSGTANFNTTNINITGTTTFTGTLQAGANNLYNIGSSTNGFRAVYLNQLFVGGVRGRTTTITLPCGTMIFTEGILKGGTC